MYLNKYYLLDSSLFLI